MAPLLIADRPGFTPQIARLIGMMEYVRETTLQAVQGMTTDELDFLPDGHGNSAGMLLEHFVAVERIYQHISLNHPNPDQALGERWMPGLMLGQLGREKIRGHALAYYLNELAQARRETLELFAAHDDAWLEEPLPLWGTTGNRLFMWFHVFEDEVNHRGQIRLLRQRLPGAANSGMTGALLGAAQEGDYVWDGSGMRCLRVWPGSPALEAGLQAGDVILELDGADVQRRSHWEVRVGGPAGTSMQLRVQRGEEVLDLSVPRVARPG